MDQQVADTAQLAYFKVKVAYRAEGESELRDLGAWKGLARDVEHAEELATELLFKERLQGAGRTAVASAKRLPRYLAADAWTHIFTTPIEVTTRWVYDRGTGQLVDAAVRSGSAWHSLGAPDRDDLLESLQHNDVESDWGMFDLDAIDEPPDWARGGGETEEQQAYRGAAERGG